MITETLESALDHANERGVGQYHVVIGGMYATTWHSYGSACAVAKKCGGVVYNMDKKRVWPR